VATGRAERDCTVDLRGALVTAKSKHRAAITDPVELGRLLVAIEKFDGTPVVKAALKLTPMLFQRPGEIRTMEWKEIDWEQERWEIPVSKMKMGKPHIVPLSRQAIDILRDIHKETGRSSYVFPVGKKFSKPLSENGVRTALRNMGFGNEEVSPHGFRATARTILDEVLEFRVDLIEHQLAHAVKDPTGRAYNRTSHLPARKEMMQRWADYLYQLRDAAFAANQQKDRKMDQSLADRVNLAPHERYVVTDSPEESIAKSAVIKLILSCKNRIMDENPSMSEKDIYSKVVETLQPVCAELSAPDLVYFNKFMEQIFNAIAVPASKKILLSRKNGKWMVVK
jgi:hypothetical protein